MEDRDWLIIKVLQEQKNITKTAQTLFISQPNLTTRIRHIEEEFGVKMIYRGSRGVHFTPEGDYLAQCAQNMLLNIRQIKEQVVNMGNEVKGTLCIGASNYLSKYKIPRLLGLFKETYPQVEFKVITSFSKDVCGLLYNQDVSCCSAAASFSTSCGKALNSPRCRKPFMQRWHSCSWHLS